MSSATQPLVTEEDIRRALQGGFPSMPGASTMPRISPPSGQQPNAIEGVMSPAQRAGGVGQKLYQSDLPKVTSTPGTPEYGQQREERADYQQMHPWGAPVSQEPGTWGKIGHVLAKVGNIAGNALVPNVMAETPGTDLNRATQRASAEKEIGQGEENKVRDAQAAGWAPITETLPNGQQVMVPWRNAAQLAGNVSGQETRQDIAAGNNQVKQEEGDKNRQTHKDIVDTQQQGADTRSANKPGSDFDQFYKDYLESHQLPDSATARLNARKEYASAGQQPQRVLMTIPQPDGSSKVIEATPGTIIPAGAQTPNQGGAGNSAFDRVLAENAAKDIATANGADFRFRSMNDSYPKAQKGDQQAMLNLLANHIGMTMGLQKGARITQALLDEAVKSTPWLQHLEARFDKNGYLSGVVLTPMQMGQMMELANDQRRNAWEQASSSADQAGVKDKVKIPTDVNVGGSGATGGIQILRDPNGRIIGIQSDGGKR